MDAASPREAIHNFIALMSEALSCVTDERFVVSEGDPPLYAAALSSGQPTRLSGPLGLTIGVRHLFEVVASDATPPRYRVSTTHYSYRFHLIEEDTSPEVIAFQWDRDATTRPNFPHLHLGTAMTAGSPLLTRLPGRFNKIHVPTGRLSLEIVLIFAIDELGVLPTHGRALGPILWEMGDESGGGIAGSLRHAQLSASGDVPPSGSCGDGVQRHACADGSPCQVSGRSTRPP